jgi:beta-N-acetylhexosaminidase
MAGKKKSPAHSPARSPAETGAPVGQLLIVGFDGTAMSPPLSSLLARIQPAGVILFARNIVNAQQTHKLLSDCQSFVREPLFTCVDLEGGKVDRFRAVMGPAPSAADVFSTGDRKLYRKHGQIIGKACRALGFKVDFAPALDLAFPASHSVMSSRAVSTDPKQVVLYAREFLAGLRSAGVIGAGKHFPGLGEGKLDSHHDLPVIAKSFQKLWEQDLVPYRAMRRELAMVMVNHANYPVVTRDKRPASLSKKWIGEVLRRKIGYRGLIVSDDLEMGGVQKAAAVEQAAVEFIRAGGDLCLVCHQREFVERAFDLLVRESERDARLQRRALEAAKRVAAFKKKSAELRRRAGAPAPETIQRLSTQLWEFSEQVRLRQLAAVAGVGIEVGTEVGGEVRK